jgi:hypothetical protein
MEKTVEVKMFMDGIITRRVVGESGRGTVYLCNETEFQNAQKEKRQPVTIGFPIEDVEADREIKTRLELPQAAYHNLFV